MKDCQELFIKINNIITLILIQTKQTFQGFEVRQTTKHRNHAQDETDRNDQTNAETTKNGTGKEMSV